MSVEPYGADEESAAVLRTVGRVIKMCRERAGLTQAALGAQIGYSEEQVSSVERGRRAPMEEFLDAADRVLEANSLISALKGDVEKARFPKKVRDLAQLEAQAVELCAYANHVVHGLLQTPEYARALYRMRRPPYTDEQVDELVEARLVRQRVFAEQPAPMFNFVQEEVTLRRPLGGKMVMRKQLEHLLEVGRRRNVEIQVLPTDREDHAGLAGALQLLRLKEGLTVGHVEVQLLNRLISDPKEIQILEIRYGIIRAQALTPRESLAFIEKVLGET
ncbi:helix-turn-helix domain-containing protein [Streptomyces griseoincarnatus]|uniref:Helix-turn-helix transcriptional regulator n=1 Tax=Streptomyces griseoincarnatus TaxID=29305 RepID=A0ABT0VN91_STRGI|nr:MULTISPECIES: helix-turn-helix transcriptional regulator [Streptomyces]AXI89470.1 transcriptional regulator [Streptomyces sp. ETH9427]MBQ0969965.1 helix-turn-helix domain-containing protein [Streptomyces sp. RK31]MCM2512124.1 helix-turn-helix transcriptional regulator [Streptomyces griseoincarnatus]